MDNKKKIASILFFLLVMGLTIYTFLHGRNIHDIVGAVSKMSPLCLLIAGILGVFFVSMEGIMIYYLMASMGENMSVLRCIQYSFIGFFYSGITPSATGGQPMQLYYMSQDGKKSSNSTVTLMTVAVMYKLVLVLIGIFLWIIWRKGLRLYLNNYYYLYLVGLALNIILVVFILAVMIYPIVIHKLGSYIIRKLAKFGMIKNQENLQSKWDAFVESYADAVVFLKAHKNILWNLLGLTFLQRCSVFLVAYMVYLGFGLRQYGILFVTSLQATVYIAVDMLPIPGSQGITEMMYQSVFANIFSAELLTPSMLVSRGINFYFLLLVSLIVVGMQRIHINKQNHSSQK